MIQIKGLNVDYFGHSALEGVTLDIPFGHSVGIIGPNGAGKSTFIKALLDVIKKRSGTVKAEGRTLPCTDGISPTCRRRTILT